MRLAENAGVSSDRSSSVPLVVHGRRVAGDTRIPERAEGLVGIGELVLTAAPGAAGCIVASGDGLLVVRGGSASLGAVLDAGAGIRARQRWDA